MWAPEKRLRNRLAGGVFQAAETPACLSVGVWSCETSEIRRDGDFGKRESHLEMKCHIWRTTKRENVAVVKPTK